jgi:hypothetical protein
MSGKGYICVKKGTARNPGDYTPKSSRMHQRTLRVRDEAGVFSTASATKPATVQVQRSILWAPLPPAMRLRAAWDGWGRLFPKTNRTAGRGGPVRKEKGQRTEFYIKYEFIEG